MAIKARVARKQNVKFIRRASFKTLNRDQQRVCPLILARLPKESNKKTLLVARLNLDVTKVGFRAGADPQGNCAAVCTELEVVYH